MLPKWFCCCFYKNYSPEVEKLAQYKIQYKRYPETNTKDIPFFIKKFSGHFRRPTTV